MTMLYCILPYGNICSLIRLFYKISYIFSFRRIVRKCATSWIRPQVSVHWTSGSGEKWTVSFKENNRIVSEFLKPDTGVPETDWKRRGSTWILKKSEACARTFGVELKSAEQIERPFWSRDINNNTWNFYYIKCPLFIFAFVPFIFQT